MSRFVLLSAALHLGALAALGYGMVRPAPFPTSSLTVTLNEPYATAVKPVHYHAAAPTPTRVPTRHSIKTVAHALSPRPTPETAHQPANKVTSPKPALKLAADETAAHDRVTATNSAAPAVVPRTTNLAADEDSSSTTMQHMTNMPPRQQPATTGLAERLESEVRDALAPYFAYPMMARRNGWQGQVRIGLRVESDGRLSHIRIARSSGYRLLDNAALTTLNRIYTLPKAANWLQGRHFDMVLPIDYRLIGGRS